MKDLLQLIKDVNKDEVSSYWGGSRGISYKGHDLLDVYIGATKETVRPNVVEDFPSRIDIVDAQESFLGYIPSEELFVSGWDCWLGNDDADSEAPCENLIYFTIAESGNVRVIDRKRGPRMIYPVGLAQLEEEHTDLVGIRYD